MELETLRDVCHVLGGLLLDGARVPLLEEIRAQRSLRDLSKAAGGELGQALVAADRGLEQARAIDLAEDYTRMFIASAEAGARSKLLVPPWEDCHTGSERHVLGERSLAAFKAYLSAGLGFEGMKDGPSDHIGIELCFVAALLDEEAQGTRDDASRHQFVELHLGRFAATLGAAIEGAARSGFWRDLGRALIALSPLLQHPEAAQLAAG